MRTFHKDEPFNFAQTFWILPEPGTVKHDAGDSHISFIVSFLSFRPMWGSQTPQPYRGNRFVLAPSSEIRHYRNEEIGHD